MKSLQRNFQKATEKNPYWSTHTCFAVAVMGKKFSKETIRRWFNKLVNKGDYGKEDKKEVLEYLFNLSSTAPKTAEDDRK